MNKIKSCIQSSGRYTVKDIASLLEISVLFVHALQDITKNVHGAQCVTFFGWAYLYLHVYQLQY